MAKPTKPNIRTINKMIQSKFAGYSIVQAKDCVYVTGPDVYNWDSVVVYTPRVSDQTPELWVQDVERAIQNNGTHY